MAKGVKPRVKVPKKASAGDSITIKTLISHKMESGQRKDDDGNAIPRSIINRFTLLYQKLVSSSLLGMMMMAPFMKRPSQSR